KEKEKVQKAVLPEEALPPEEVAPFEEVKENAEISKPKISKAFPGGLRVFGQQLFSAGPTSFTPPSNMPVSTDYIIGPDDNIVVQLWGRINEQYTLTVQRDGSIQLPQIGTIQVAGLTYKQLQDRIKREAEAITGVNVNVTMGKLRSITVFVVGAVKKPGAYTVSAFDTILNALIYSRGPGSLGSMRNIQLKRHNKRVTTFDLYDLILKGDNSGDMRLEPGDIIFVPKAATTVGIHGDIKVPAVYELKKNKSLLNALKLAGGIKPSAYSEQIQVQRYLKNRESIVLDMSMNELKKEKKHFDLQDGDIVKIFPIIKKDANAVYLFGNITRPGKYEYSSEMRISDIVKADDLEPETYFPYALIKRYNPPEMSAELVPFNLGEGLFKHNMKENILLQPGDEIHIFSKWTFKDKPSVTITGEVRNSGKYLYEKGMHVKDAIFRAGGLTLNASMGPVNIFRTDPRTKEVSMIVIDLAGAMTEQADNNIILQDKDRMVIHSIREYKPEKRVSIHGGVKHPGEHPLSENMTIRDLVFAAGNLKESAYIYSAELTRYDTSGGKFFKAEVKKINLEEALKGNPENNIRLRKFDSLFIPTIPKWQKKTSVSISGEVKFPGNYNFAEKGRLSELIERAGGYLPESYLRGAVLTRESVKVTQKIALDKLIFEMEQDLAASAAAAQSGALSKDDVAAVQAAMASRQMLLAKLKTSKVTGRVVIRLTSIDKLKKSKYDMVLESGDTLNIPQQPGVVNVMGSVYNPTALLYEESITVKEYLSMVGGPTVNANPDDMFIIRADGTIVSKQGGRSQSLRWDEEVNRWFSGGFYSTVLYPGDTILVPRKLIEISGLKMTKDITSIIYQIAVSIGVLHTLF
ncbi:MAG: SLBB domain-containing protein, partial [Thermodesulfobacteriota bacterium]|nr:SLBB domain-containing protein [Thermodesulfobacteriota bacterium]